MERARTVALSLANHLFVVDKLGTDNFAESILISVLMIAQTLIWPDGINRVHERRHEGGLPFCAHQLNNKLSLGKHTIRQRQTSIQSHAPVEWAQSGTGNK